MIDFMKTAETIPYPKMLSKNNGEMGTVAESNPGSIEWFLKDRSHKDNDSLIPFNKQLESARTGHNNAVVEVALNENEKLFLDRRSDKAWFTSVMPNALLVEAYDQKRTKAFNEARQAAKETEFWDKLVGSELIGEPSSKIPSNPKSQLQNHPDRFTKLPATQPTHINMSENAEVADKDNNFYKMVTASLRQADAMLFHIYALAATEKRPLNEKEEQMVNDINSTKARILSTTCKKKKIKNNDDMVEPIRR